jgi:hypothetical protein
MTVRTLNERINTEIDRLKLTGEDFCPADLGKKFGVDAKMITQKIRDREDIYRKSKCSTMSRNGPKGSVWGFRKVPA